MHVRVPVYIISRLQSCTIRNNDHITVPEWLGNDGGTDCSAAGCDTLWILLGSYCCLTHQCSRIKVKYSMVLSWVIIIIFAIQGIISGEGASSSPVHVWPQAWARTSQEGRPLLHLALGTVQVCFMKTDTKLNILCISLLYGKRKFMFFNIL